jgi:hypothetical protein
MRTNLTFHFLFWLTLTALSAAAFAANPRASVSPNTEGEVPPPSELAPFVPSGWVLRARARGDLNSDGRADWVIVIEGDDSAKRASLSWSVVNTNPRRLIVLIRDAKQALGYRQVGLSSDRLIPPAADELPKGESAMSCAEDPLHDVAVRNRVITATLVFWSSCGSWSRSQEQYRFRIEPGRAAVPDRVRLIGVEHITGSRAHGEQTIESWNLLTGKKQRTDVTVVPETRRKTKVSAIVDLRPLYIEDVDTISQCREASKPKDRPWCS